MLIDYDALNMITDGPSDAGFHFIQDFLTCEQYWGYKYYYGLEPLHDSPYVLYGHAMHVALEKWYALHDKGASITDRVNQAKKEFLRSMEEKESRYYLKDQYESDRVRGLQTIEGYGLHYFNEYWKIAKVPNIDGVEQLAIEIPLRTVLPSGVQFTGRIDMVAYNRQGHLYLFDHKNTGWVIYKLEKALRASAQATGYLWLWNETFPDKRAHAVIFNVLKNLNGKTEYKQTVVYKTEEDIEKFKRNSETILNRMLDIVESPEPEFVMNTGSCMMYGSACPYINLCRGENFDALLGVDFKLRGQELPEEDR